MVTLLRPLLLTILMGVCCGTSLVAQLTVMTPTTIIPNFSRGLPTIPIVENALSVPLTSSIKVLLEQATLTKAPSHFPRAYKVKDLAFFCRLEVQMERSVRFPIKVRLGEVQYVERMEGKGGGN